MADVTHEDGDGAEKLHRIRNMWQFANLCQWIYIFGKSAKINESIDIEELEIDCLKPNSSVLDDIALALLKLVSSHRGITHGIFDDQARKQYHARAPGRNPFGSAESPECFSSMDVILKIQILQQLTQWVMIYPERLRDQTEEQKDSEQTTWRIEPYGWDSEDRTYFVLDDNRVYRLTERPLAPTIPKARKKSRPAPKHRLRRTRGSSLTADDPADSNDPSCSKEPVEDNGLDGKTWECVAITLEDVQQLLYTFHKTKDENEKILRKQLGDHLLPILEKQEESRRRREVQRERELMNMTKLANAKRSSRIAGKREREEEIEKTREDEQHRRQEEAIRRKDEQQQLKMEKERDFRLFSREKRLRERESRRVQHEEELAQLSESSRALDSISGRKSERNLQRAVDHNKRAIEELDDDNNDDDWIFDCVCGTYGQIDDGTHSIACERCNIWQHSRCVGVSEEAADRPDFHYLCAPCRRPRTPETPKTTIKLTLKRSISSAQGVSPLPNSPGEHLPHSATVMVELHARPQRDEYTNLSNGSRPSGGPQATQQNDRTCDAAHTESRQAIEVRVPVTQEVESSRQDSLSASTPRNKFGTVITSPDLSRVVGLDDAVSKISGKQATTQQLVYESPASRRLLTPQISHEIHRATYFENGALPSGRGESPIKSSPKNRESPSPNIASHKARVFPPTMTLSPKPKELILTPPIKSSEPLRKD